MERVAVIGNSGAGKSRFAVALAWRLAARHIELDGIYHLADWQPRPTEQFVQAVDDATVDGRWVVDGNYLNAHDLIIDRADTIVWLDYSRLVTTSRIVRRSFSRVISRRELWNGNRENWRKLFSPDPAKNVILWSLTAHSRTRKRFAAKLERGEWSRLKVHRLTKPSQASALLQAAAQPPSTAPG